MHAQHEQDGWPRPEVPQCQGCIEGTASRRGEGAQRVAKHVSRIMGTAGYEGARPVPVGVGLSRAPHQSAFDKLIDNDVRTLLSHRRLVELTPHVGSGPKVRRQIRKEGAAE